LGKTPLSGFELMRLNGLSSLVSSILITGRSELRRVALGNGERKQFSSKVKQYKRLLMNEYVDMESYYCNILKRVDHFLLNPLKKKGVSTKNINHHLFSFSFKS
jgi:hypothetical protein